MKSQHVWFVIAGFAMFAAWSYFSSSPNNPVTRKVNQAFGEQGDQMNQLRGALRGGGSSNGTGSSGTTSQPKKKAPKRPPEKPGTHELHLKDGRTLVGKVVMESEDKVGFSWSSGGKKRIRTFSRAQITRIVKAPGKR